jgi:hypothetical protein
MSKREAEDAFNVNIAGFHEAARMKAAWILRETKPATSFQLTN